MAISSLSFSNLVKVIKTPKKNPKDTLIESHAGMLKIDN